MDVMELRRGLLMSVASGGRDYSVEAALIGRTLSGSYENPLVTIVGQSAFMRCANLESVSLPNCTEVKESAFRYCSNLVIVYLPSASIVGNGGNNYIFAGTKIENIALPSLQGTGNLPLAFQNVTTLKKVDIGDHSGAITNQSFAGCTNFGTLILRCSTEVWGLGNTNVFNNTKFASGGAGGTIYIPTVMYNHLGDGGALDYKAASNWSTINGYGTITWAKIEGSAYESTYADGTLVI